MKSLLQRVFPGAFGAAPPDRRQAPRDGATDRRKAPVPVPSTARPIGARRPLIATTGETVGYEFRVPDEVLSRLKRRNDQAAQAAHVTSVLTAAVTVQAQGRIGFARVPASWLLHSAATDAYEGVMIGLQVNEEADLDPQMTEALDQAVEHLRAQGARLGWGPALPLQSAPDFVLLRQGPAPMAVVLASVQSWSERVRSVPVLMTDIASVEDLETALSAGIQFACGALTAMHTTNEPRQSLPVAPEVRRVGQILYQLVTGAETEKIAAEIKGDLALSYRLLRRINSAGYGRDTAVNSIDQAVMLLGRNELYRWLYMLLLQFGGTQKTSSALQEIALWRARLFELLAQERPGEDAGQMFTLGMASMLGQVLRIGLTEVVDTLKLPDEARAALIDHTGPWLIYLQMAKQIEAQSVNGADSVADQFGGADRVLLLSEQAWNWARENSDPGAGKASAGADAPA